MIRTATFTNLTSVPAGQWEFAEGLNVIIGENGLGKSHVLKALYALLRPQSVPAGSASLEIGGMPNKVNLERTLAESLVRNMRPEALGRLVKRRQGHARCEIEVNFRNNKNDFSIAFSTRSTSQVAIERLPSASIARPPIFFPTRELITLCPWFVSLYENYGVEFEESWRDTVSLLGAPILRGAKEKKVNNLLEPIEAAMGGKVEVDPHSGRFYLRASGGRVEAPLVAEGMRKFAMVSRLISTGALLDQGYLFWDEPEANLNPRLIRTIARVIVSLARQGIQVFVATHSLFLLREIELLTDLGEYGVPSRYFSIASAEGEEVSRLEQGDTVDLLKTIVLLDEELAQSERYINAHAQ